MNNIIVFGDSITVGAWDEQGGWVSRMWAGLFKSDPTLVYNLGVDGDTTRELAHRIRTELSVRADGGTTVILAIGANDSSRIDGVHRVALGVYALRLKAIIKVCKGYTPSVYALGLTHVDESCTRPVEWDKHLTYANADIDQYDFMLRAICRKHHVGYVSLSSYFIPLTDGVHPDSHGHEAIAKAVVQALTGREMAIERRESRAR